MQTDDSKASDATNTVVAAQFGLSLIILMSVAGVHVQLDPPPVLALDALPTDRPTPTATPDWWNKL